MSQERLYHVVAVNNRTNKRTRVTGYAMSHAQCCTMKSKFTRHPTRSMELEEA